MSRDWTGMSQGVVIIGLILGYLWLLFRVQALQEAHTDEWAKRENLESRVFKTEKMLEVVATANLHVANAYPSTSRPRDK